MKIVSASLTPPHVSELPAAEWVGIDAVHAWPHNPRKNDGVVTDKVAASISEFGFANPIVARRENGEIIAGHTRWKAARKLGLTRIPVRFLDLDEKQSHFLALADNRIAEEAEWDDPVLAVILKDMKEDGLNLALAGFEDNELAKLMQPETLDIGGGDVGPADELRDKWQTETGQRWEIGRHRLLVGDSTQPSGFEPCDMMWTDPPYGVSYVGKTKNAMTIDNDELSADGLCDFLSSCFGVAPLKCGSPCYIAHPPGALSMEFMKACQSLGWRIHQQLVWKKNTFAMGRSDYHYAHEPILLAYTPGGEGRRGRGGACWYGDNAQASVFEVDKPSRNELHPTMKPIELIVPMIRNSSPPGGTVFEPFCGSGSTLLACEATGRSGFGIELDPKYAAVTIERLVQTGIEAKKC